jgi:2-methylcitrate dehydratase PrpD
MNDLRKKAPVLYDFVDLLMNKTVDGQEVIHQVKRVVADTYGVAFGGVKLPAFKKAYGLKSSWFSGGEHEVWGTDDRLGLQGAVFFNALSVSSTDYDEGHRQAVGHPASTVVPVALELGRALKKTDDQILKAVLVGYEAGTRFSRARKPEYVNSYSTGRWGALAAAATVAVLMEMNRNQFIHALSLAYIHSPAMQGGSTDVSTGSMAKEGVAFAVQAGMQSALLASEGFRGPYLFLDAYDEIDRSKLLNDPADEWLIMSNYFKPFACCRWLHTAVAETLKIMKKESVFPEMIEKIEVKVFGRVLYLIESKYPENIVQAQFHMPYVIACSVLFGRVSPDEMKEDFLANSEIKQMIDKVILVENERFNQLFPEKLASGVKITLKNGLEYYSENITAPWDAGHHPTDAELYDKYKKLTGSKGENFWERFFH